MLLMLGRSVAAIAMAFIAYGTEKSDYSDFQ